MISFKEYLLESVSGNYVSVDVKTPIIIKGISEKFPDAKVCGADKQHVTLIYSTGTDIPNKGIEKFLSGFDTINANVSDVVAFDSPTKDNENDSEKCAIVIKLNSSMLSDINKKLSSMGMKHSYPEFSPHVSILYDVPLNQKQDAINFVKDNIKSMKTMTLSNFKSEPLNTDWKSTLK